MPTQAQLVLLAIAALLLLLGGLASLVRLRWAGQTYRAISRVGLYGGLGLVGAVLAWHSAARGQWQPMTDNFDAMLWLALILGAFVVYIQLAHPLPAVEPLVILIVAVLAGGALVVGRSDFHEYQPLVNDVWLWVHRVTAYLGGAVFAVAAASGVLYVIASRKLQRKSPVPSQLGSLERLERLTMIAVTLGFALLTVGTITGVVRMINEGQAIGTPKLVLSTVAWLIYAVVLHVPINPRLRGRRAAILSVAGFLFIIGAFAVVLFSPGGRG